VGKLTGYSMDWTDVESAMRFVSATQEGRVGLTISPRGIGASGGLDTSVFMTWDVLPDTMQVDRLSVNGVWPCDEHGTLEAHILNSIYRLDAMIYKEVRDTTNMT